MHVQLMQVVFPLIALVWVNIRAMALEIVMVRMNMMIPVVMGVVSSSRLASPRSPQPCRDTMTG